MTRMSKVAYWMGIVDALKARGTCPRRQTSALIVDNDNHIVSTGYNGPPKGMPHCIDDPCEGVGDESGDSSRCVAVHAEANAILQASERIRYASIMYCSTQPCFECSKLIAQTRIGLVIYGEPYPDPRGENVLQKCNITSIRYVTGEE